MIIYWKNKKKKNINKTNNHFLTQIFEHKKIYYVGNPGPNKINPYLQKLEKIATAVIIWGCRGRMVVGCTTTYAISAYSTKVVSSNPTHGQVYSLQWLVAGLWFSPGTPVFSNKTDCYDIAEILLIVVLNTITLTPPPIIVWICFSCPVIVINT